MKKQAAVFFLGAFFCLLSAIESSAQSGSNPPPLKKVTLYKHGVGYFERQGKISGDQQVTFLFDASQINDVLKSLVVLDLGKGSEKGKISSVTFDSTKPVDRKLEEFGITLDGSNKTGMTTLLGQLRGAKVEVRTGAATVSGIVIGIEKVVKLQGGEKAEIQELVLISEAGELRSIGFDQIRGIRILDAKLREDLDQYLDILQSTFHKNLRRLTISATGQGERDMFVSYVVEAPVWKTTYRLVIDSAAKPFLQGWALIDNLQDEDWNNVTLSLISGAPVSFIHDLQQPIYRSRPVIAMPENVSVAPQLAEPSVGSGIGGGVGIGRGAGIATGDRSDSPINLVTPSRGGVIQGTIMDTSGAVIPNATIQVIQASTNARITVNSDSDGRYRVRGLPPGRYALNVENSGFQKAIIEGINISAGSNINQNLELRVGSISEAVTVSSSMASLSTESASAAKIRNEDSGVDVNVDTQDIGELFEYRIAHPVSIKRNSSALIPILQNQVDGEMVSLYNRSVREQNPMNALYLKNNTGLTLESGPITIIENDTYAGEAMLGRIKPAEKRFVTYAVDLGCRISVKEDDEEERAFFSQIVNGEFRVHYKQLKSTTYSLNNLSDHPKIVYLEHPYHKDEKWQLVKTPKPDDLTENYYRFKITVAPKSSTSFSVREELPEISTYAVSNITTTNIELFVKANYLNPQLKQALEGIIDLKAQISSTIRQLSEKQAEIGSIARDQDRMRENLRALGKTEDEKQLVQRYVSKLSQGEDQLERLRIEEKKLLEQRSSYQKQLDDRVRTLSIEHKIS